MSGRTSSADNGSTQGAISFDVVAPDLQDCLDDSSLDLASFGKVFDQLHVPAVFARLSDTGKSNLSDDQDENTGYVCQCTSVIVVVHVWLCISDMYVCTYSHTVHTYTYSTYECMRTYVVCMILYVLYTIQSV
jgi:hypothetical protein